MRLLATLEIVDDDLGYDGPWEVRVRDTTEPIGPGMDRGILWRRSTFRPDPAEGPGSHALGVSGDGSILYAHDTDGTIVGLAAASGDVVWRSGATVARIGWGREIHPVPGGVVCATANGIECVDGDGVRWSSAQGTEVVAKGDVVVMWDGTNVRWLDPQTGSTKLSHGPFDLVSEGERELWINGWVHLLPLDEWRSWPLDGSESMMRAAPTEFDGREDLRTWSRTVTDQEIVLIVPSQGSTFSNPDAEEQVWMARYEAGSMVEKSVIELDVGYDGTWWDDTMAVDSLRNILMVQDYYADEDGEPPDDDWTWYEGSICWEITPEGVMTPQFNFVPVGQMLMLGRPELPAASARVRSQRLAFQ